MVIQSSISSIPPMTLCFTLYREFLSAWSRRGFYIAADSSQKRDRLPHV